MKEVVALFGEANKGEYNALYLCSSLEDLFKYFGEPPSKNAQGIHLAIQTILSGYSVLFVRVKEEGFSYQDYFYGLELLQKVKGILSVKGISLPGIGSVSVINTATEISKHLECCLIIKEDDFYDLATMK